jgi:hypothetical protein
VWQSRKSFLSLYFLTHLSLFPFVFLPRKSANTFSSSVPSKACQSEMLQKPFSDQIKEKMEASRRRSRSEGIYNIAMYLSCSGNQVA